MSGKESSYAVGVCPNQAAYVLDTNITANLGDPVLKEEGQRNWQRLVKSARNRGLKADAVPVKSEDGVYIIYTSGVCPLLPLFLLSLYTDCISLYNMTVANYP